MKIVISSDKKSNLTDFVIDNVKKRGHEIILMGVLDENSKEIDWPNTSHDAAMLVGNGQVDQGIIICWSGTGACIASNKVKGVRGALVSDARTAVAAKVHNHANVLNLSIRLTSEDVASEILDAWFSTEYGNDDWNKEQVEKINRFDQ